MNRKHKTTQDEFYNILIQYIHFTNNNIRISDKKNQQPTTGKLTM